MRAQTDIGRRQEKFTLRIGPLHVGSLRSIASGLLFHHRVARYCSVTLNFIWIEHVKILAMWNLAVVFAQESFEITFSPGFAASLRKARHGFRELIDQCFALMRDTALQGIQFFQCRHLAERRGGKYREYYAQIRRNTSQYRVKRLSFVRGPATSLPDRLEQADTGSH